MNQHLPAPGSTYRVRPLEPIASKKRRPFMTLIVGIKSKTSVILVSDSQISYGHSSKRMDIPKIEEIEFKNFPAIVALSGNVANAHRFTDILKGMAPEFEPKSADEVGVVIQAAMRTLRNEVRDIYGSGNTDDLDKIIIEKALDCSMMIGFRINEESHLVQTNLLQVRYQKSRANYEADGCGGSLADYILAEYYEPDADANLAALIAIYAVWVAIQYDSYCGGEIMVRAVSKTAKFDNNGRPRVVHYSKDCVNDFVRMVQEIDAAIKATRHKVITEQFSIRAQEFLKTIKWEMEKLPPFTAEDLENQKGAEDDAPSS